jgi:hypothetical protein
LSVSCYPIYVVMTMRSDFLSNAVAFHRLAEAADSGIYQTLRQDAEQGQIGHHLAAIAGRWGDDPVPANRPVKTNCRCLKMLCSGSGTVVGRRGRSSIEALDSAAVGAPRD